MNHDDFTPCLPLDAYFNGELSRDMQKAFAAHLDRCEACRDAIDQQRWIDELLTSDAAARLEMAPQLLAMSRRARLRRAWFSFAAAATLAALAALPLLLPRRGDAPGAGPLSSLDSTPTLSSIDGAVSPAPAAPLPTEAIEVATFVSTGAAIALPAASPSPDVTVVQLYPTLPPSLPARRSSTVAYFRPSSRGG